MLTKTDLKNLATQTRSIVQEETPRIVRTIINEETPRIVRAIILEETPLLIKKELKPIKRKINKIDKLLHVATKLMDEDHTKLRRRVDKIESQFGI